MQNKLKVMREAQKLTQDELALKSGVSRVTISSLETGKATIAKTDTLVKIADALGKTVTEIFFCA